MTPETDFPPSSKGRNGGVAWLALGIWLSITAVWPTVWLPIGKTQLLYQPLLILTLTIMAWRSAKEWGWAMASGRALWIFAVLSIAAWLPVLRTTPTHVPTPRAYEGYLLIYEVGLAMLMGWQAAWSVSARRDSWWTIDGWSKPLIIAPMLLACQALRVGDWVAPAAVGMGAVLGVFQGRRGWTAQPSPRTWRLIPVVVFIIAGALVFVSALRIYSLTGAGYPDASDDGRAYYLEALAFSKDPRLFFTAELKDKIFFSSYYVVMGLWFWLVRGPHIPSWLVWHGVAGGLLAVAVYWIGRQLTGRAIFGVVAGLLVAADHVMLHLLSTMNQETFFFTCIYGALLLWSQAATAATPRSRFRAAMLAGLVLGVSVTFRTASIVLPIAWCLLLLWERPKLSGRAVGTQMGLLLLGLLIPVALMVIRHRIAWGYWSLAGDHMRYKIIQWNYALQLPGGHLVDIGFGEWVRQLAAEPHLLWQHVIPSWWKQGVELWTHRGFGQMDLVQGLNHPGPYQAALTTVLSVSALVGILIAIRQRTRLGSALLSLPVCFTSFVLIFYVLNSRYRSPFIPALYLLSCLGFSLAVTGGQARVASASSPRGT